MLLIQCAWMIRHDPRSCLIHGRKTQRVSRGALSRCKAGQEDRKTRRPYGRLCLLSHALPETGRAAYAQDGARGSDHCWSALFAFIHSYLRVIGFVAQWDSNRP